MTRPRTRALAANDQLHPRRYTRVASVVAASVTSVSLAVMAAVPAWSQSPPPCPVADEGVFTFPPDYVRQGGAIAFTIQRRRGHGIAAVTVTYSSADGQTTEVLEFGDQDRVRAIRPVPEGRRAIRLHFEWAQDEGTPAHCLGVDDYPDIPVIAANARAGDPAVPRLSGRWAIRYSRRGTVERARWTLTPRCDVFGCRTGLRSSGGFRGSLEVVSRRQYRFETRERYATCEVTYGGGRRVDWTIFRYVRVTLRPTRLRNGAARGMIGHRTSTYDAPSDEFGICPTPSTERSRIRARRLR